MNRKGFSLVELIVVIAILGIIAVIAVPAFSSIQYRMSVSADKLTGTQIGKAVLLNRVDTGKLNITPNKLIKYNTVDGMNRYITNTYQPVSMNGGYYVVSELVLENGKEVLMVGITKDDEVGNPLTIEGVYDGGNIPGWVWSEEGKIDDFIAKNQDILPSVGTTPEEVTSPEEVIPPEEVTYIISYNSNSGTGVMTSQRVVAGNQITLSLNTFVKEGYIFKGWATTSGGDVVYTDSQTITPIANMSLYVVWENLSIPTMAASDSWWNDNAILARNEITAIEIVDNYTVTGNEDDSWAADEERAGKIMCYINGTTLTIAGNGSGKIYANSDSSYMFSDYVDGKVGGVIINTMWMEIYFENVISIEGLEILDTSKVTNMYWMFTGLKSIEKLDFSSFNTSNVTNMRTMFWQNYNLKELDLSSFDTSNVTNMDFFIDDAYRLEKILLGEKFKFVGNFVLPVPNSTYILNADGKWYTADGTAYTSEEIANRNVAETYYAVDPTI